MQGPFELEESTGPVPAAIPPRCAVALPCSLRFEYHFQMKPLSDCRLYTFVDTAYLRGRAPELVARQLCDGGSDIIQLRAKNSPPGEIRRLAKALLPITRR